MVKVIAIVLLFILSNLSVHCIYVIQNEEDIEKVRVVTRKLNDFHQRQRVRLFNNLVKTK